MNEKTINTIPMSRRNDRYDTTRAEVMLIRAGHHLRQARRSAVLASIPDDYGVFDAALETIWKAKREVRAELKAKRAEAAERMRAYFAERRAA